MMTTKTLGRWLRRHSLTLVAALGGAAGVTCAVSSHVGASPAHVSTTVTANQIATPELPRDTVQDTVQIALLLDTSSSMDGLINQARSHLWKMVDELGTITRVVDGKQRSVKVELALYEYGNSRIPSEQGYIRQVLPFSTDLDTVSEQLHGLFTSGGSEYAGQAIQTAVTSLQWSNDPAALRFVFVAGNESFDQGPVTAEAAMKLAAGKDITVQLIHCGSNDLSWVAAAKLASSDLMNIDQSQVARHIPSPQDDEILRLGAELNNTYLAYGAQGRAAVARQAGADMSSAKMSKKVALERSQLKAKKAYRNESWDVVDAVERDKGWLATAKDGDLPAEMRGKTLAEKEQLVAAKAAQRAELKAKIAKLEAERTAFIKAEEAKQGATAGPSLDTEMMKTTKKMAGKKGYKF